MSGKTTCETLHPTVPRINISDLRAGVGTGGMAGEMGGSVDNRDSNKKQQLCLCHMRGRGYVFSIHDILTAGFIPSQSDYQQQQDIQCLLYTVTDEKRASNTIQATNNTEERP